GDSTPHRAGHVRGRRRRRRPGPLRLPARRLRALRQQARAPRAVIAAVAAGHPATTAAGVEILAAGGSAADAAVAAALASSWRETVMPGLLGGGHALYYDAATGRTQNLDCFVSVPGLGAESRGTELEHLDVPFGAEVVRYAIGAASCGVPGLPAGLVALWQAHGRLPWETVVEPAL